MKNCFFPAVCILFSSLTYAYAQPADGRYVCLPEWYGNYDVKFYKIDIEADNTSSNIEGCAEVVAAIRESGLSWFTLELDESVRVDSVLLNRKSSSFRRDGDLLHIFSPEILSKGKIYTATVYYAALNTKNNGFFSAVSNQKDTEWNTAVTWSLSEPYNAKVWFPCKQHLSDKADSAHIFITVPRHLKAGAPGTLSAVRPMPGNKSRYEWKTRYPVAYYLLSFAVSDYADYSIYVHPKGMESPVLIQNYVYDRDGFLQGNRNMIDSTGALMEVYSKLYLPYPYANEKYGHCVAPMGGGMEHQTMTTLSGFDFLLVAHELAHQWFGNLVTCASFQDVWINEGFATYAEYLALEHLSSRKAAGDWMRETHSMATWAQDGSVFVPKESANDMWRIFNMSLSYKKGAALVHHIRYMIDDDAAFFGLLREFLTRHAYSSATAMDFKRIAEEKTGIDFTVFFDQWYYGEGFPVFNVSWEKKNGSTRILIEHKGSSPSSSLFVLDMDILIHRANGTDTLIRVPVRSNRELLSIPDDISGMEIDPGYYVLKEVKNNTQVRDLPTGDDFVHCEPFIKRKQNLTVGFAKATGRNCRLTLTDAPGRNTYATMTVKQKKNVTIPMEDMPNGVYLLYVENGKEQYVRKIVKTTY